MMFQTFDGLKLGLESNYHNCDLSTQILKWRAVSRDPLNFSHINLTASGHFTQAAIIFPVLNISVRLG